MSGEQERKKMAMAQQLMKEAQVSVARGTVGSTAETSEALERVQQVLSSEAKHAPDVKTEKTIEDMAKLAGATETLVVEKDVGDRLQRIAKEAELAQEEIKAEIGSTGPTLRTQKVRQHSEIIASDIGPLFQLITSSHEFRALVADFIKIARQVLLRTTSGDQDIGRKVESEWLKGTDPATIAKMVGTQTTQTMKEVQEGKRELQTLVADEDMDLIYDDVLRLLATVSQEPRYHDGINRLFRLIDVLRFESEKVKQGAKHVAKQTHADQLRVEAQELVAQFTGHEVLDNFMDSVRALAEKIRQDDGIVRYLKDVRQFILGSNSPTFVKSEEFKKQSREFVDRARQLMDQYRYTSEVDQFLNSGDELIESMKNDDQVRNLRRRAGILMEDLTYEDSQGVRHMDTQVLSNIRRVIVPVIADAFKYIPIPRIEQSDEKRDFMVDNIVLCGYDVIPDNVFVHLESDSWLSVRELETERSTTRLIVSLRNIRTELKDLQFLWRRKVFPQLEESGIVTVRIGGKGATLNITFRVDQLPGESIPKFTSGAADFNIDQLDLDFDRSTLTHDILVPMITSMFKANIVHSIERGVEQSLANLVNTIGSRLTEALSGTEPRFMKQLEFMKSEVKRGEFSRTYEKRQQKLE